MKTVTSTVVDNKRVLVIDDDVDFADSLSDVLSMHGFEVKTVHNAETAIERVAEWRPQVALVDNHLGPTHGVDLIPQLKEKSPEIICVMITAYSAIDAAIQSVRAGASDYLRKPVSPQEIVYSLNNCFDKVELLERQQQAEAAMLEREAKLQAIMANVADGILMISAGGAIEAANPAAHRLFGYQPTTLVDLDVSKLIPGGVAALENAVDAGPPGQSDAGWTVGRRRDGEDFNMELAVGRMTFHDDPYYAATMRDVTERLRHQSELEAAKTEAELANGAKSEFLANVSHELRTPLNAILGFSEMLMASNFGALGSPHYEDYAKYIHESGSHLLAIITDILDVSKIEAGKLALRPELIYVDELCDGAIALVKTHAQKNEIDLVTEVPPGLPRLIVDPRIMKQILINLLSNAVKFTKPNGTVKLTASLMENGDFRIVVSDTGIGIATENIERVLLPFGQVHDIYTKDSEGTGLGLPLAKKLAELHDGVLTLESEVGVGTTVTVDLPADRVVAENT